MVPLRVGSEPLRLVLDTGTAATGLSQAVYTKLASADLVTPLRDGLHRVRSVTIADRPIPDLIVRISPRASQLGIDGLLGLDFLGRYEQVHFHVPSMLLSLTEA